MKNREADRVDQADIKKAISIGFSVLIALLCFYLQSISGLIYTETDNLTTAFIVNGLIGDSNYCMVLHPWLCGLLGIFSGAFPSADVFASFTQIFMVLAFFWVSYLFTNQFLGK